MAIYEYKCKHCNHVHEEIRPMSESDEDSKCEKCGKKSERIISPAAVIVSEGSKFFTKDGKF